MLHEVPDGLTGLLTGLWFRFFGSGGFLRLLLHFEYFM